MQKGFLALSRSVPQRPLVSRAGSVQPPQMSDTVADDHLSASIALSDEGFWDYLGIDEVNLHRFVSHSDGGGAGVCGRPAIKAEWAGPLTEVKALPAMRT